MWGVYGARGNPRVFSRAHTPSCLLPPIRGQPLSTGATVAAVPCGCMPCACGAGHVEAASRAHVVDGQCGVAGQCGAAVIGRRGGFGRAGKHPPGQIPGILQKCRGRRDARVPLAHWFCPITPTLAAEVGIRKNMDKILNLS